jgi:DNA-binding response OmpR family regulator
VKVLVVDDDRTTRFLLRRALITEFGCAVTEARDGIEALEALAKTRYGLVILDVQMPLMDGLETLRALRQTSDFEAMPVVMLTAERDEHIVQQIAALGVLDYMTKPLVPDRVVERLRRVIRWLTSESELTVERGAGESGATLDKAVSVLVVDGSEDFRRFLAETLASRCTVFQAESGARGFRVCIESHPDVVFIGSNLGVLNDALLVKKIRATTALRETFLIGVVDKDENRWSRIAGYDGHITRTFVPAIFLRQFDTLSAADPGALRDLLAVHAGLRVSLISAAEQVFAMMLSAEVSLRDGAASPAADRLLVVSRGSWGEGSPVELYGRCDVATGRRMAASLLGIDPGMVRDDDVDAAVSEVLGMIGRRLRDTLAARQVSIEFDLPAVSRAAPEGAISAGIALWFHCPDQDLEFGLGLRAGDHVQGKDAEDAEIQSK